MSLGRTQREYELPNPIPVSNLIEVSLIYGSGATRLRLTGDTRIIEAIERTNKLVRLRDLIRSND